jgi:3-deoxy-D-manno-octulosonic-acid transferase
MYLLYSVLLAGYAALRSPAFVYRAWRHGKYVGSLAERLGRLPASLNPERRPSIWVHAVSVGEVLAVRPMVAELSAAYPHLKIFVSTTTATGQQVARERLEGIDGVFYFPFDLARTDARVLDIVRPELFLMVDTEIWPNLLRACRRRGVRTVLVNGRMSRRSYPRYRLGRPFFRRVLDDVDRFCVQSAEWANRFIEVGARPARVSVTGSLKFDALDVSTTGAPLHVHDRVLRFFRLAEGRPVLIAASTLRGEEQAVLSAFRHVRRQQPDTLLVIAPRHPDRFGEAYELAVREGFRVMRRSELTIDETPSADVVILDTIGELPRLYQIATSVFVGGSLVDAGGHNLLEPAVFGKPIVFGPYMHNFAEIADLFLRNEAACQVQSPAELERELTSLCVDAVRRARLGAAARALVEANRGARTRTLAIIADVLPPGPRPEQASVVSQKVLHSFRSP